MQQHWYLQENNGNNKRTTIRQQQDDYKTTRKRQQEQDNSKKRQQQHKNNNNNNNENNDAKQQLSSQMPWKLALLPLPCWLQQNGLDMKIQLETLSYCVVYEYSRQRKWHTNKAIVCNVSWQ